MSIYTQTKSFASAILLVCASAFAETPEALVRQALQRNPELNFFVAEIAAANGAVRTAGTLRNPELSTELGYKNSRENSGGANGDGAIVALSFSQTFEYPGRIALRKAIANHDRVVAELHLQQFRLTLAARVRSLAYALSSAGERTKAVQEVTGQSVEVAFVDQGYTGEQPAADAAQAGLKLEVVKHHEAKRGFVLLPRRWVVERSFAWAARFRRLARDYERLASTMAGYHWLAFAILMLQSLFAKSA